MVPNGQKLKIQGIVMDRNADLFRVRDTSNVETIVLLTPSTTVRTHRHGVFGGGKPYAATYILRGLRLQAEGVGNSAGQLVADTVKFDEQDLRTAQALQQTDEMTRENAARIAAEEQARKEEQQKLAGQIAENQALTAQAQASANAANARAEEAQRAADRANNRINGLGNYDQIRNWTIYFRPGSAVLSMAEKQKIDAGVVWVRSQPNTDAWFVSITGFADTRGNTAYNRSLSERRANAVIGYLVAKHNMPLTRLIQPFGYGESNPASANTTAEGRAKNRRVEIKILQNKGIAGTN
jgi:outer membrane protein OmpA-like peptidoglycan-associated protein